MFDVPCAVCKKFITAKNQEKLCKGGIVTVATMIDSKKFTYGLSGVWQFAEELNLKKDDEICNVCMKKLKDKIKEVKTIKCTVCNKLYQPCWEDSKEEAGWGCSSYIVKDKGKKYLDCGWGSNHDLSRYEIASPELKGRICDDCIDKLVEEKKLIFVSNSICYN